MVRVLRALAGGASYLSPCISPCVCVSGPASKLGTPSVSIAQRAGQHTIQNGFPQDPRHHLANQINQKGFPRP